MIGQFKPPEIQFQVLKIHSGLCYWLKLIQRHIKADHVLCVEHQSIMTMCKKYTTTVLHKKLNPARKFFLRVYAAAVIVS